MSKRKSKKSSSKVKPVTTQVTPTPVTAPRPATQARELTEEEKEVMNALGELVESAQELSYALAVAEESVDELSPELKEVIRAAKAVVKSVWKFHRLVKRLPRAPRT